MSFEQTGGLNSQALMTPQASLPYPGWKMQGGTYVHARSHIQSRLPGQWSNPTTISSQQPKFNEQPTQLLTDFPRQHDGAQVSETYTVYSVSHVTVADNSSHNRSSRPRRNSLQTIPTPVVLPVVPPSEIYQWPRQENYVGRTGNRDASRSRQPSMERTGRRDQSQSRRGQSLERTDRRDVSQSRRGQSLERTNLIKPRAQQPDGRATPHADPESRSFLKGIADSTIAAINNGIVDVSSTQKNTCLFREDASALVKWRSTKRTRQNAVSAEINVLPWTTLQATLDLHSQNPAKRIGILNFASATSPGGGFLSGAQAQEESIARSSTLYVSLTTATARPFYALHYHDEKRGFYTHTMIYSPAIYVLRKDDGEWLRSPIKVDILTCAAVNAREVRKKDRHRPSADVEKAIREVMRERMGRILALFERKGARQIVLGSYGTGVFQNDVQSMAELWNEFLYAPNAPFSHSFDHVVFAIPDQETRQRFALGFKLLT